jgi:hypothetical protein
MYQMVQSGPAVQAEEVEIAHAQATEVLVMWGTNVLHVAHLRDDAFYVGDEPGCDYLVPDLSRTPVVTREGALVITPRTTGHLELAGNVRRELAEMVSSGAARPSSDVLGAYELTLPPGAKARVELSGITFQVSSGNAGKAPPVGAFASFEPGSYLFSGLSFLLHVGVLASLAFFMPSMGSDDSEAIGRDQILMMQHLLNASAEHEPTERDTATLENDKSSEGGSGQRAGGEEGTMGTPTSKNTNMHYAVHGPTDNPDPHLAREAALREAAEIGMVGLLRSYIAGDPNAPTAPWGREDSSGNDPMSARGNMWGDAIGDSGGIGGLGLTGTGEGGGCNGSCQGIGLDHIGTIGHGAGGGDGDGFGRGHGRVMGGHEKHPPSLRQGNLTVNGRLPPEIIQRIVRQNFGRFKLCYEDGLRTNPSLQGRVAVKFAITRDGTVSTSQDGGSDIPDTKVSQCVIRGFSNLSFPQPEGGIVTVVYPITFSPGD